MKEYYCFYILESIFYYFRAFTSSKKQPKNNNNQTPELIIFNITNMKLNNIVIYIALSTATFHVAI